MFEIGDKVVHNYYGLCLVRGISERRLPGQGSKKYYEISPLQDDQNGTTVFISEDMLGDIRPPMTREQILAMIDAMPDTDPLQIEPAGNRVIEMENLKNAYTSLVKSGSPRNWVILLRTIWLKDQALRAKKKRLSGFESQARDDGERLLFGEIAGVMEIPRDEVERFIARRIEAG